MRIYLLVVALLLAAGCNPGSGPGPTSSSIEQSTTTGPTTSRPHPPPTVPPFEEVTVALASGAEGEYLVDGEGRALYLFTLDDERTSTCHNACAEAWPPLLGDPVAGEGVDQSLLGNAERDNGSIQVTYDGHPLYRYSGDATSGDTNGHGFNDVWFLVTPGGTAVTG